jgi:hypothetical protein
MPLQLPPHRLDTLSTLILSMLAKYRTSTLQWQKFIGNLHSMVPALLGLQYLFSILQTPLLGPPKKRFCLTQLLCTALQQWLHIATTTHHTPALGASDASKTGMGGFWVPTTRLPHTMPPLIWRHHFPDKISHRLTTRDNPAGNLSINDLELMALIQAYGIATQEFPPSHPGTYLCATDNTAAHSWVTHGSTTTERAPAHLLTILATLTCTTSCTLESTFTASNTNTLADFCSRSFHLDDAAFLKHVNTNWPMQTSWKLAHPHKKMPLLWTSALYRQTVNPASACPEPPLTTTHGSCGHSFAPASTRMSSSPQTLTQYPYSNSLLDIIGLAHSLPPVLKCVVEQWKLPYEPLDRHLPHWAARIPGCSSVVNWTFVSNANSWHTRNRTPHLST